MSLESLFPISVPLPARFPLKDVTIGEKEKRGNEEITEKSALKIDYNKNEKKNEQNDQNIPNSVNMTAVETDHIDDVEVETEIESKVEVEDDLRSLASPIDEVSDFIKSISRQVFSLEAVWGSRHNLNSFLSAVDR